MGLLSIFTGPYALLAKWGVIALLVAAFGGWAWFKGNEHGTQKLIDFQGKLSAQEVRIAKAREVVTTKVITRYVKVAGETKVVTNTVEKEVIKYAESNPGHCLDLGWRRLHDAAALNKLPDPTPGTDAAPRAAEALEGVTASYAACHRTADRLDSLQEWVREQAKVK